MVENRPVERGVRSKLPQAPRRLGTLGGLSPSLYKVHQNAQLKNSKFSPQRGPQKCFPGPHCGSRREW